MDPQKPAPAPINIDLTQTSPMVCEACQGESFQEALMFRTVSALLTGTGRQKYIPIQVVACIKCGHIPTQFIPQELRNKIVAIV